MMKLSWRIYIALFLFILILVADTKRYNTYVSELMAVDSTEVVRADEEAHLMHNRPITQKTQPNTKRAELKGGVTLDGIVDKYIDREEKLHYSKDEQTNTKVEILKPSVSDNRSLKTPVVTLDGPSIEDDSSTNAQGNKRKQIEPAPYTHSRVVIAPLERNSTKKSNVADEISNSTADYAVAIESPTESNTTSKVDKNTTIEKPQIVYPRYKVKKGDTLIMIAMRYSVESKDIAKINNLGEKRHIRIGQKLKIPMKKKRFDIITQAKYTVESGDSLGWIAKHFNVGLKDLKKYNKLKGKAHIRIGQKLVLPLPYKLAELKRKAAKAEKKRLRKKRERARLARIALNKRQEKRFGKLSSRRKLSVHATAYTSHSNQTDSTPFLAAWNNRIRPGMKIIAVSRDLITKYGITNGSKVRISGLRGVYVVKDKMNKKWRRKIDIYMGTDRRRALRWGKRRVVLYY